MWSVGLEESTIIYLLVYVGQEVIVSFLSFMATELLFICFIF